jgi:hypothetical protein
MGGLTRRFAGLLLRAMAFDDECLSNMGKVEVIVELGGDPDFSGFNPAMLRGLSIDEVGLLSISEEELNVGKGAWAGFL